VWIRFGVLLFFQFLGFDGEFVAHHEGRKTKACAANVSAHRDPTCGCGGAENIDLKRHDGAPRRRAVQAFEFSARRRVGGVGQPGTAKLSSIACG
jgi:hypothetical protein